MTHAHFICSNCRHSFDLKRIKFRCPHCKNMLDITYDYAKIKKSIPKDFKSQPASHWKYKMFYPVEDFSKVVTLQEGGTPLIRSDRLSREIHADVLLKFEGSNPTGSFKDRGSTVEITKALERKARSVVCASTGNMGASIAAYSARAGLRCKIILPTHVPKNKIEQIRAYSADIEFVHGQYSLAVEHAEGISDGNYLTGDYPFRCEGQKSVGFEICDQLKWKAPDFVICPVGNGTVIYSVWKAFKEMKRVGLVKKLPKVVGVQASGCSPVVNSFEKNLVHVRPIEVANTIANAIACENPSYGNYALKAVKESKGFLGRVSDKEIVAAVKALGSEGVFAEPSGAASVAMLTKSGKIFLGSKVVCIISGHGLKDAVT